MIIRYFLTITCIVLLNMACEDADRGGYEGEHGKVPTSESWGSKIILSDLGVLKAIVKAGHTKKYQEKKELEIDEGIQIDFYDREGNHSSTLTAQMGYVNENTKNVKVMGNVVVISSDKESKLETEELRWNAKEGKIYGDEWVRISVKNGIEEGTGFKSDPDLKEWTMKEVTMRSRKSDGS